MRAKTDTHCIELKGNPGPFCPKLQVEKLAEGLFHVHLELKADTKVRPPQLTLSWTHPVVDICGRWNPGVGANRGLVPNWTRGYVSKSTSGAPVTALYNYQGRNRLTFAFSDALNPVVIQAGVVEETAEFACSVTLFSEESSPISSYQATLRLDTRDLTYAQCLNEVQEWWASLPGYEPAPVPETARLPMYSTWYSFHQHIDPDAIVEQCQIAKELGCEAVIVDDGWQTDNNDRGYAYCGDWEPEPSKVSDMREFVSRVHDLGMKFILWYSVPFVGRYSKAWNRFAGKLMESHHPDWRVLDPRFPEVREYLIGTYERAVREWDLDGFKLDFVDSFNLDEKSRNSYGGGRDFDSLPEAVDCLLKDALCRLRQLKPDIMVEFRQSYIGPLMRTYGNMFRAGDCPNDSLGNRIRTLDIRLLCGSTAVHSDMLMWNSAEPVESAAMQFINILFSVPQVSVRLNELPDDHFEMVRFWLGFWREHRDVLLGGKLNPRHPEAGYASVVASGPGKQIAVVYSSPVVELDEPLADKCIVVNGSLDNYVVMNLKRDHGPVNVQVVDCRGRQVRQESLILQHGLNRLDIPPAGAAYILSLHTF